MSTKYIKLTYNKASVRKVYQMIMKDIKNSIQRPSKIYQKTGGFGLKINHLATLLKTIRLAQSISSAMHIFPY
jgi:hypothetical protein